MACWPRLGKSADANKHVGGGNAEDLLAALGDQSPARGGRLPDLESSDSEEEEE